MTIDKIHGPAAAALDSLSKDEITFLKALPKAELHAHLNGSIPISTLEELAHEHIAATGSDTASREMLETIENFKAGVKLDKIADFFSLFPVIYTLTSSPDALRRVTRAVLQQFLDGDEPQCTYLELRTGPRKTDQMSREDYMRTVLDEVEKYDEDRAGLIMTLDRPTGPETWKECLDIALSLKLDGRRLLGVDLAGDPLKADVEEFRTFFAQVKAAGLGITLHIAEVCNKF